jgi:tetratricopeptide (TPR) repeat protein
MLPPTPMLTIKKRVGNNDLFILLTCLALLAGCTPPGPRALLQGQRLIEQGNYAQAAEKLRAATSLLATNAQASAQAWNYLGVACHHLGERDEAVRAYQNAFKLNHDLSEAHYNLGCLWLEENKLDAARTEFTAYTLRRGNSPDGFLKLATVQARAHDFNAAEKSFNDVLRLSPKNPEALNGLGLLRLQQHRPAEADQFFAVALKAQPDFRPALLNSAIVAHQYLRDLPGALQKYRAYLALKPPPPNAESVTATVRQLEQELTPPPRPVTVAKAAPPAATNAAPPKPTPAPPVTRVIAAPKAEPTTNVPKPMPVANPPKPTPAPAPAPAPPVQVVKLAPEPVVKPALDVAANPAPKPAPILQPPPEPIVATAAVPGTSSAPKPAKRGFLERVNPVNVFRSEPKPAPRTTPLPPPKETPPPAKPEPLSASTPLPPSGPASRYNYRSPAKPAAGNREEAQRFFDQGLQAQQAHRLTDAIQAYRQAIQQDPSFFEAQFYLAFAATEAGNLPAALTGYEYALAINPDDANARYNFALVLKQANCIPDAVNELERLLASHPSEARAHLALANLYAQQLRQPATARQRYLKALELDPRSPQASDVRNWLRDHPQ